MCFEGVEVLAGRAGGGPEEGVVVGEEGEDGAEEEGCCCREGEVSMSGTEGGDWGWG